MQLSAEQQQAVEMGEPVAVSIAGTECVLVRKDVYLRLNPDFDMGPWTIDEMNLLADEVDEILSRNEANEN
jgi:propanediol utilization protein